MPEDRSVEWVEYTSLDGEATKCKERVVTEFGLSIVVNGSHLTTAMITPMMEREFVIGHLFGRGLIDDIAEIKSIIVKENVAEVSLVGKKEVAELSKIESDLRLSREDIFNGVKAILKSKIYAETGAIHSAGLFKLGAEPVCIAEDIGRHNALDKIIGYGLMNKVEFENTFATSTGRMASDMVTKICRAKIPIVATKTAVTRLGIDIGQRYGVTIIGFVRGGEEGKGKWTMKIYTNPQRIY